MRRYPRTFFIFMLTKQNEPRQIQLASFTFTNHAWQFIIFTVFTITTCIFSYSFNLSFWTQNLFALRQILSRPLPPLPDWFHGLSDDLMCFFLLSGCLHGVLDYKPTLSQFSNTFKINALSFHLSTARVNSDRESSSCSVTFFCRMPDDRLLQTLMLVMVEDERQ